MESQPAGLRQSYLFHFGALLVIFAFSCTASAASDDSMEVIKRPMWMPNWMDSYMKERDRAKRPMWMPNWMREQLKAQDHKRPMWLPNWAAQRLREQYKVNKRPMWMPGWASQYLKEKHRVHKRPLWTPSWQLAYMRAAKQRLERAKRPGSYNPFNWMSRYRSQHKRDHPQLSLTDSAELEVRKRPVWLPFYWRRRYLDSRKREVY